VQNGRLQIRGEYDDRLASHPLTGLAQVDDSRLEDVPLLGKLLPSSLGLTAQGNVDMSAGRVSMNGTVVPAYALNSALGRIPFVGKIFSPEKGGGLFAARYSVDGPFGDASVSVNPLSVLTPGFLRGLFDIGSAIP
jgi:hypothetical protein